MVVNIRESHDLERLLERSKTGPVLIFKHSTQCSVSNQAYKEFQQFANTAADVACGVVLVIEDRSISNAIAAQLGIRHESPQAIVIKDGQPIWNASHWSITADSLSEAMKTNVKSSRA